MGGIHPVAHNNDGNAQKSEEDKKPGPPGQHKRKRCDLSETAIECRKGVNSVERTWNVPSHAAKLS